MLAERLTRIVKRLLRGLDGFARPLHRFARPGLLRLDCLQLALRLHEPAADRFSLSFQSIRVDLAALGLERPRPGLEPADARFEVLDTGLLRVHGSGRLALAFAQRFEFHLQGLQVFLDVVQLAPCARRLLLQVGQRRLLARKPRGELFALPALGLDLESRRFHSAPDSPRKVLSISSRRRRID